MSTNVMTRPRTTGEGTVHEDLQATVVELIELSLQAKQAHWNVTGPLFRSVHLELDEIVETARWATDEVAERMATIGLPPDGRSATVAEARPFDLFVAGSVPTGEAVEKIGAVLDELSRRLSGRIERLGETDPISQGILIEVAERLEKHAWMLRAQRS
jgi:starvation-inducible DNA-binding protein